MKRYASPYLYVPDEGYLRQQVIETENGCVINYYPLREESEEVVWLPGLIELAGEKDCRHAFHNYPFDFSAMRAVDGTQRTPLL